ncbi:hypothetical protein HDU83_002626 [Entophlyctis luteolus]|nr:hypothetical protein HDU82_005410 [Entophlyctis luteolus]KAJ3346857.1 hypothetical protein HDU83_002626 [Entophlyctis luteolus]
MDYSTRAILLLLLLLARALAVPAQATTGTSLRTTSTVSAAATASVACNSSALAGSIIIENPNGNDLANSAAVVGGRLNITWEYNTGTTVPKTIAIYYANIPSSGTITAASYYENSAIVSNLNGATTTYIWTVPSLQTGNYKLRVVGDGIDPAYYSIVHTGQSQCYASGQALPGTSLVSFIIAGNSQLVSFSDNYGPSNSALPLHGGLGVLALVVGLLVAI